MNPCFEPLKPRVLIRKQRPDLHARVEEAEREGLHGERDGKACGPCACQRRRRRGARATYLHAREEEAVAHVLAQVVQGARVGVLRKGQSDPATPAGSRCSCQPAVNLHTLPLASMKFSSGKGVVRGRGVQQTAFASGSCSRARAVKNFRLDVFLDFASSSTRTMHPHEAYVQVGGSSASAGDYNLGGLTVTKSFSAKSNEPPLGCD